MPEVQDPLFSYLFQALLWTIPSFFFVYVIARTLYVAYGTSLSNVPGPWSAKFSRIWLLNAINSRKFETINLDIHRKYGPIVRISPNEVSIDDFEASKIIYRSRDELVKAPRYDAWGLPHGEANLFTTLDIQHHTQRRRQVNSLYTMGTLINIEHQVGNATTTFSDKMTGFANSGEVIDIAKWIQFYASDAISYLTFGKPMGFLEKGSDVADILATIHTYARYGSIMGVFSEWHSTVFRLLQMMAPTGEVGIAAINKFATETIDQLGLDEKKKSLSENRKEEGFLEANYISSLFSKYCLDPEGFTIKDIYYHALPNVIAGAETTGIALCATVYYLCKNPKVLRKLREELGDLDKTRNPQGPLTMKEAQSCVYLQAVIKETFRMFPSTGLLLSRIIPKGGLTLANTWLPEGTVVGINPWVAHFNREIFGSDVDEFRPERWLGDQALINRMEQYSFAFGRGPRTCMGKNIPIMEMSKLIPELVQNFDVSFDDPQRDWTVHNDWFVLQQDFQVKISKRGND